LCEAKFERRLLFRKLATGLVAALIAATLFGSTAQAVVAPRITKAATLPTSIVPGSTVRVTPAVANLKATRTYVFYLAGQRIVTGAARTLKTFSSDNGSSLYAIESLKFANKKVLTSRTKTVVIGTTTPVQPTYLWSQEFNDPAGVTANTSDFDLTSPYGAGDGSGINNPGWGNNEREWYIPSSAKTDGQGNLVLPATKTTSSDHLQCYYGTCTWKSAKLITLGKIGFKYGRLEIRAKLSGGQGQWPAIWLLGANQPSVGWPQCGEVDIAEWKGDIPNMLWGTLHGPGYLNQGNTTTINGGFTGYHTYRIDWVPNQITWYLDGVQYHQMRASDIGGNTWVFNTEQYLLLNVAMGGNFVGNQIGSGVTQTSMSVDWIHYSALNGYGTLIRH
jgi:beta-glucanase (GH16 family)